MARIKSAWEIALEKTKDITIDEEKYKAETLEKEGMALAGAFLNDVEQSPETLQAKLSKYSDEEYKIVRTGLIKTIFSNIVLPSDNSYQLRFERTTILSSLADPTGQAESMMAKIGAFFEQFLAAREEFGKQMEEQMRQALEQNPERANASQYAKLVEQNLKRMEDQYNDALENSKEGLREIFGC